MAIISKSEILDKVIMHMTCLEFSFLKSLVVAFKDEVEIDNTDMGKKVLALIKTLEEVE